MDLYIRSPEISWPSRSPLQRQTEHFRMSGDRNGGRHMTTVLGRPSSF